MKFDSGRLSHAYITDKPTARALAAAVVCGSSDEKKPCDSCSHCDKASRNIHPDIIKIDRTDNKQIITVDQIRELKQDVYILPNEAEAKVYVVNDADTMNINAQNAFLQILEEPPAHANFILYTDHPMSLLKTIRSRCVFLRSGNIFTDYESIEDYDEVYDLAEDFINGLSDDVRLMECMFRLEKLDKAAFLIFFESVRENVVSALKENIDLNINDLNKYNKLIKTDDILSKANEMLILNVSPGHIAGFICASVL